MKMSEKNLQVLVDRLSAIKGVSGYRAHIMRDDEPNASVNNRTKEIRVADGLLHILKTKDELAHVLGHELSHDDERTLPTFDDRLAMLFGAKDAYLQHVYREAVADRLGSELATKAGFEPCAGASLLKTIINDENKRGVSSDMTDGFRLRRAQEFCNLSRRTTNGKAHA